MNGIWTWPSRQGDQERTLRRIMEEDELVAILVALDKNPEGMSNAQLDRLLANNSQWRTLSHLRELSALGFILYDVQFFGEAGKYKLTELGMSIVSRLQALP